MKEELQLKIATVICFIILTVVGILSYYIALVAEQKNPEYAEGAWFNFAFWFVITFFIVIPGYIFMIYCERKKRGEKNEHKTI